MATEQLAQAEAGRSAAHLAAPSAADGDGGVRTVLGDLSRSQRKRLGRQAAKRQKRMEVAQEAAQEVRRVGSAVDINQVAPATTCRLVVPTEDKAAAVLEGGFAIGLEAVHLERLLRQAAERQAAEALRRQIFMQERLAFAEHPPRAIGVLPHSYHVVRLPRHVDIVLSDHYTLKFATAAFNAAMQSLRNKAVPPSRVSNARVMPRCAGTCDSCR